MGRLPRYARAALLAVILGGAALAPASAEIYRWKDAKGREHFTMDLHQVPPEHRAEARRQVELDKLKIDPDPEPPINTMKTPDGLAVKRALRPRYAGRPAYGASPASASADCAPWQRQRADELSRNITRWQQQIELNEERERRLVRTDHRINAANRIEEHKIQLERAEAAREDFEDEMRRKGVPPGCYQ